MGYKNDLENRLLKLERAIQKQGDLVFKNPNPKCDEWMAEYNKLANLRLNHATVKSQIDKFNQPVWEGFEIIISKQSTQ